MSNLKTKYKIAIESAIEASYEICRIYKTDFRKTFKADGSPVTEADKQAALIIEKHLRKTNIPIIHEEDKKVAYSERKKWKKLWMVDPLDGTKEFVRRNGEFALNIALIKEGVPVFGLIASPLEEIIIIGGQDCPAKLFKFDEANHPESWQAVQPMNLNQPIILASSRTPYRGKQLEFVERLQQKNDLKFVKKGSALKFIDLACGDADVYPRFAPTMEWDTAAGQAILTSLGGSIVDANTGEALVYNKKSLFNPHFIAQTKHFIDYFATRF